MSPLPGEEPPESLFMKELKKRGITPTLLEDRNPSSYKIDEQIYFNDKEREFVSKEAFPPEIQKELLNQRERSMALNSEGLEGLIPRAKVLLTLGGTFFLGFGPLLLLTVSSFFALYLIFGSRFIHDGSSLPVKSMQYVDPYALLNDQRLP